MSDDELQDGEERHIDVPLAIIEDEVPEDEIMPPVEEAVDGVLVGVESEEEDELDVDPELLEQSY